MKKRNNTIAKQLTDRARSHVTQAQQRRPHHKKRVSPGIREYLDKIYLNNEVRRSRSAVQGSVSSRTSKTTTLNKNKKGAT